MAATQKKKGGSRAASSRKRTAPSKSRPKTQSTAQKPAAPAHRPCRRELGAVLCLLLAIFSAFGCFHMEAIFIDFFAELMRGLIGYGFWLMPPALLMGAYILAFHRGRPVALRLICTLLMPMVLSCVIHGMMTESLPWDQAMLGTLWASGQLMQSGGAVSGLLAQVGVSLFTGLGSTIVYGMVAIMMGLKMFSTDLWSVADWIYNRPRYEYEPQDWEDEPRRGRRTEETPVYEEPAPVHTRRAPIDIPVDEGPLATEPAVDAQPVFTTKEKKRGFFNRKSRVPAPDQILTGRREEPAPAAPVDEPTPVAEPAPVAEASPEPVQKPEPEVLPEPAPVPEPAPAPVEEEPVQPRPAPPRPIPVTSPVSVPMPSEPSVPTSVEVPAQPNAKMTREESAENAALMTQECDKAMSQESAAYQYPPLSLLTEGSGEIGGEALAELNANKQRLSDTIHSFGIEANIINVTRGPSVTRYELELDQGVRLNKLTNLSDDIALALGATGVRIAPIPDRISMVGIEVPNKLVSPVNIHNVIGSKAFTDSSSKVSFAVGKDIGGNAIVGNIAKMPHLLIAGTTGSGKSVCTNSLIISLLYKATPEEVRLIMVDPKMVELGIYNGIPHLLIPVVTDPKKAAGALQWAVNEMMKRYRTFAEHGVRDLASYNALAAKTENMTKMPQVVVIIDELADLMLVAAKEVEESICRVAQMGRASGMHLIIATQRPSADVITGLMKANIPSRIAFAVASSLESRIILDITGAEKLVGRGDMLYFPLGAGKPTRVQGCLITDQEVAKVVDFVKQRSGQAEYDETVMQEIEHHAAEKDKSSRGIGGSAPDDVDNEYDELIDAAAEVVVETGQASVSMLQRRLKLGYARAARLVDQLEEKGIVGPFEGSKPRQLLITKEQWQELKYRNGVASASPEPEPVPVIPEQPVPVQPMADVPPFDVDDAFDRAEEDRL